MLGSFHSSNPFPSKKNLIHRVGFGFSTVNVKYLRLVLSLLCADLSGHEIQDTVTCKCERDRYVCQVALEI